MEEFLTFKKFNDPVLANDFGKLLKQNGFNFELKDDTNFDPSFANNFSSKQFTIKLKPSDFEKVNELLLVSAKEEINLVDKDYYLYEFTDKELIEIVTKPEEWNEFDYLLAQKLLKERGKEINPEVVDVLKKQRQEDLSKPEAAHKIWIVLGYLTAISGGLIGIFIGLALATGNKTLSNGTRVYSYAANERKHGRIIVIIGTIVFGIILLLRILYYLNQRNY